MKIGIDAQPMMGNRSGVGQYTQRLVDALQDVDNKNEYQLVLFKFFTNPFMPPLKLRQENFTYGLIKIIPGRVFGGLLRRNLLPPLDLFLGKKDLYLFPNFTSWPLLFSRSAVVIYDMSVQYHPQFVPEDRRRFLGKFTPKSIKRASLIITISDNSKKEIAEYYGLNPGVIVVVPPALNTKVFYPRGKSEVLRVKKKYQIKREYILFTSTIEPRKNIVGLLDAYNALPENLRDKYDLVLAGGDGWKMEGIERRLKELKNLRIHRLGYVSDDDLPALTTGASLMVYPSFYEGFGMPPLEAMGCGTPVITSNNSSLPQAVGDAGILLDAEDAGAFADAITRVLTDPKLSAKLVERGYEQIKKFTWQDSAAKLLAAIESLNKEQR